MEGFDLVVIGAGQGGLQAARQAKKSGANVAIVDERDFGGECLYDGCVPSKTLIRSARILQLARRAGEFGISVGDVSLDFAKVMSRKDKIIRELFKVDDPQVLERAGISTFRGTASFANQHELNIDGKTITSKNFIIATGSLTAEPPIKGLAETGYITNVEALHLDHLPKSLVIVGAGATGIEFAQLFRRLGAEITVIEMADQILPNEDRELTDLLRQQLESEGITMLTSARATKAEVRDGHKVVTADLGGESRESVAEEIIVASGRKPNVERLNLEAVGVEVGRKGVQVDSRLQTTAPNIWAVGDVNGAYLFTHVARYEGLVAAHNATSDEQREVSYRVIPWVTFTDPELARVGLTEDQAREEFGEVAVGRFRFRDLAMALIVGEPEGMVKIISKPDTGEIVGGHILSAQASSMIPELVLAMRAGIPVDVIAHTVHTYPTLPEAIHRDSVSLSEALELARSNRKDA
jgi:dihydrolipoamide dehydrogenase